MDSASAIPDRLSSGHVAHRDSPSGRWSQERCGASGFAESVFERELRFTAAPPALVIPLRPAVRLVHLKSTPVERAMMNVEIVDLNASLHGPLCQRCGIGKVCPTGIDDRIHLGLDCQFVGSNWPENDQFADIRQTRG